MSRNYHDIPFVRYADDGLLHFRSEKQARYIKDKLAERFRECGLELHPIKTKIFYCKDDSRKKDYETTGFVFLGFTFRPRLIRNKIRAFFVSFSPAMSRKAAKNIRQLVKKDWKLKSRIELDLKEIAL